MNRTIPIPSGDHTSGTLFSVYKGTSMDGESVLRRILVRLDGNGVAGGTVAIYRGPIDLLSLTDQQKAEGEVFFNDELDPTVDPTPELHVAMEVHFNMSRTQELYAFYLAAGGDAAVSGTVEVQVQ